MADHLYLRTTADRTIVTSHLDHASFQIDHVDEEARHGWSILLNGPITQVDDPSLLRDFWSKAIDEPQDRGHRDAFFNLTPSLIRGHRIGSNH